MPMKTFQEKWNNGKIHPCDWDEVADEVEKILDEFEDYCGNTLQEKIGGEKIVWIKQFIFEKLQEQDNEFRKTLNSGRKMYEIGKKDERERIKSDLLKVADEIEGEELRSEVERYFKTIL